VRRSRVLAAAVVIVVGLAAACSNDAVNEGEAGDCPATPGANCAKLDLRSTSMVAANLQGIDFSGADLTDADLHNANLVGANFSGANLAGTNLAGASLQNANFTKAFMFGTNLTDANVTGANQTGAQRCNVVETDGSISSGFVLSASGQPTPCGATVVTTVGAVSRGAASIVYFRFAKPKQCFNDVSGDGVDLEWYAPNANTLAFFLDDLRIDTQTKPRGSGRVPFVCNGKPHTLSIAAYGASGPAATARLTASFPPPAPLTSDG
jgi:pentapeptide repeat protein